MSPEQHEAWVRECLKEILMVQLRIARVRWDREVVVEAVRWVEMCRRAVERDGGGE